MIDQYNFLSELIFSTVYQDVIGNDTSPYNQLMKKLYNIDTDYFEKIPADTETLDKRLNPALRDQVVEVFKKLADSCLDSSYQSYLLEAVHKMIDANYPNANPESITKACEKAKNDLLDAAKFRFDHPQYIYEEPCPKVSEARMMQAYQKAKKRTIIERINKNNKADIINFHHILMQKTVWDCKELIEERIISSIEEVLETIKTR